MFVSKSWLIGKDSDAGREWRQEEKWTTEDEMAGWHHWLDGHESEWTLGIGDGQGGLAYCDSWGCKELDTTEWLNWTELYLRIYLQGNCGETDIENRLMDMWRGEDRVRCRERVTWKLTFISGQFSHSVESDSLWPQNSQHARPPCPSPIPRVHSDSRPSTQWCHPVACF